jgi:MSHA biogenesis protein MshN
LSLINSMLRDLDQRQAETLDKSGIARHVRALPPGRELPWRGLVLALSGALCGAGVVWLLMSIQSAPSPAASPATVAPELTAAPMNAPAPQPVVTPPKAGTGVHLAAPDQTTLTHLPGKPAARPMPAEGRESGLRLDRVLVDVKPAMQAPARSVSGPVSNAEDDAAARIDKVSRTPAVSELADTEYRKGMNALKRGVVSEAVAGLSSALRIDGRHLQARQALLGLYVDQKMWNEAIALGVEGLALDPKQTGWAMLVGRLRFEQGDNAGALTVLEEHAKYAERNGEYQAFFALLLQKVRKYSESIERYRTALALRASEGRWWYGLGLALEGADRKEEARQAFRQARATGNLTADLAAAVEQKLHP